MEFFTNYGDLYDMSYFAKVLDGKVINIIVAEKQFFDTFIDTEPGEWIETSYGTYGGIHYEQDSNIPSADQSKAFRKNYAGVGFAYDRELDAFIPPKPYYESWILNKDTCLWEAPKPYPTDGKKYFWNEENISWQELTDT